jgi:predicted RNase H-like HicB family nuclease
MTTLVIQEQRGKYYAEVPTLNGTNIQSGNTIIEAFHAWYKAQRGFFPTNVKLTVDGNSVINPINEFIGKYS